MNKYHLDLDLMKSDVIIRKCKDTIYAQNLYAAMCNNWFEKGNQKWMTSWRGSGNIVADIRNLMFLPPYHEDYIDWYCSGMAKVEGYVEEGFITEEIAMDLFRLGWSVQPRKMLVDEIGEGIYINIW